MIYFTPKIFPLSLSQFNGVEANLFLVYLKLLIANIQLQIKERLA